MPGENQYQYGQPTTSGAPQPPTFYPPPPGHPGTPPPQPPQQNRAPARSAFTDIPVGDYIRDGVAGVLLFVSFFLPWTLEFGITRGGSGGIIALVVLLTLLSLASLGLPYFARLGMLGQNWQVGQVRVLRLALNGPLIAMVVVFLLYDVIRGMFRFSETSSIFTGDGIGSAAWFGVAGALLAAQPRAAELRMDSRAGSRWLGWIKPLLIVAAGLAVVSGLLSLIFVLVSASRYSSDGGYVLQSLVGGVTSAAVPVVVLGVIAAGAANRFESWRLTVAGLGPALLVGAFFLSFDDLTGVELFHNAFGSPYYAITLLVAASVIAYLPFGLPAATDATHAGYVWLDAARNGLRVIAFWSFGTAFSLLAYVITQAVSGWNDVGESIALAVFALLIGVLAVVGAQSLAFRYNSPDPRPSREVVIGICLGLLALMIGRLITQSIMYDSDFPSVWVFDLAMSASTIIIALSVAVAPAVRDLYSGVSLFASVTAGPSPVGGYGQSHSSQVQYTQSQQFVGPVDAASDPRTSAATLFEIATTSPELRPAVAANPSTYEDLIVWLGKLGDPAVDAALSRRAAGQFGLPEGAPGHSTVSPDGTWSPDDSAADARPSLQKANRSDNSSPQPSTATTQETRIGDSVASDPNTPAVTLFEIATNSPSLRPAVAANPSTYADLLTWLGQLGDPAVDAALAQRESGRSGPAQNRSQPAPRVTEAPTVVVAGPPASSREHAATDPGTPAAVLFDIASNSPELRPLVAANPATYDDLLEWLGKLGDPEVDAALTRRAEKRPAADETAISGVAAESKPDAPSAVVANPETAPTLSASLPAETAEQVATDEDKSAVSDPMCPAAVLFRVAEHRPDLRVIVAGHPNAYPGLLTWLGGLGDSAVNDALAQRR